MQQRGCPSTRNVPVFLQAKSYSTSSHSQSLSRQSKQPPSIINLQLWKWIVLTCVSWEALDNTRISHLHGPLSAPHRCQEEEARRCHLLMGCACRHHSRESAPGPALCSATALVWQRGAGSVINAVHQNLIAQPQLHRKQPKESGVTELLRENYSAVS